MINPLTLYSNIKNLQTQVLAPLYTIHSFQTDTHDSLLFITGKTVKEYKSFIVDVCNSSLIRVVFKVIKALGGAEQLTTDDFNHFTNYVKDGGLDAMILMLESDNKEDVFVHELIGLPQSIQDNAFDMLTKARALHEDYISDYLLKEYGIVKDVPPILYQRMRETNEFIDKLVKLAHLEKQLDEVIQAVENS